MNVKRKYEILYLVTCFRKGQSKDFGLICDEFILNAMTEIEARNKFVLWMGEHYSILSVHSFKAKNQLPSLIIQKL